jgi:hypothetical protein
MNSFNIALIITRKKHDKLMHQRGKSIIKEKVCNSEYIEHKNIQVVGIQVCTK